VNAFFDDLGRRLAESASREGAAIEPPTLDPAVAKELLELARVAAHTQERRFAPLSTFVAGIAAERLRSSFGTAEPEQVAQLIRQVWQSLDQEHGA
jgi:hypothetical protein